MWCYPTGEKKTGDQKNAFPLNHDPINAAWFDAGILKNWIPDLAKSLKPCRALIIWVIAVMLNTRGKIEFFSWEVCLIYTLHFVVFKQNYNIN